MSSHIAIEIEGLEHLNKRGWHYVSTYARKLAEESEQLRRFVQNYVESIDGWLPAVRQSEGNGKEASLNMHARSMYRNGGGETTTPDPTAWLHKRQKQIYRAIAKRCHPDVVHGDDEKRAYYQQLLQQVNDAYASADSGEMMHKVLLQLEREAREQEEYLEYLRKSHNELQELTAQLRGQLQSLQASPEYRLKEKFQQAQSNGESLLRHIVRQLMITK